MRRRRDHDLEVAELRAVVADAVAATGLEVDPHDFVKAALIAHFRPPRGRRRRRR